MKYALLSLVLFAACDQAPRTPPTELVIPPGTSFGVRGRWDDATALTYRVEPEGGTLEPAEFRAAAEAALDLWRATGVVDFREAGEGRVPSFTIGWSFQHGATMDDGVAQAGPVQPDSFCALDPKLDWSATDEIEIVAALAHEIGHLLGLDHNDDPSSLLYPVAGAGRRAPGALDVAALYSLYGGGGVPTEGDLVVFDGNGLRAPVLRGVGADPTGTEVLVTDIDGDGADDILVWTTDVKMYGATRVYRFGAGPVLARTDGPIFALVGKGRVRPDVGLNGERVLVTLIDDERYRLCVLDERGRPAAPGLPAPVQLVSGAVDEDGDSIFEVAPDPLPAVRLPEGVVASEGRWQVVLDGQALVLDRLFEGDLDGDLVPEWVGRVSASASGR